MAHFKFQNSCLAQKSCWLVVSTPSEKYLVRMGSSSPIGVNIKNIWVATTQDMEFVPVTRGDTTRKPPAKLKKHCLRGPPGSQPNSIRPLQLKDYSPRYILSRRDNSYQWSRPAPLVAWKDEQKRWKKLQQTRKNTCKEKKGWVIKVDPNLKSMVWVRKTGNVYQVLGQNTWDGRISGFRYISPVKHP